MAETVLERIIARFYEKNRELEKHWSKEYFYQYCYDVLSKRESVLDLGCGSGSFLKLGGINRITGIDASYESLKKARKVSDRIVRGNILELPFSDASFDGINCSHVIEHFNPDDAYRLLLEMDRVLKIGGMLVISTPVLWRGFFDDFTHVKPYYPEAIMHYYGREKFQTTKNTIDCVYEIREIKWRYTKAPLKALLLPGGGILNTLSMLLTEFLGNRGVGKYVRTGYTMILKKIR